MPEPVTAYINATESLVDFAYQKLSESSHWTTYKLPGMDSHQILDLLPDIRLPAVTVTHESSSYGNQPRRTALLTAVVILDATDSKAEFTTRTLADEVISRLDNQILNSALFRIKKYHFLSNHKGIVSHQLEFEVSDH